MSELIFKKEKDADAYYVAGAGMFNKNATEIFIPAEYKGKPVTRIADEAFSGMKGLVSVTVADGVTAIGNSAFKYCGNLKTVKLPDSITFIGSSAFAACYRLSNINLPKNLTEIKSRTFELCLELNYKVDIPHGVTSIGYNAFLCCNNIRSVSLPSTLTHIEESAFEPQTVYKRGSKIEVFYWGNERDRALIDIEKGNDDLISGEWTYNTDYMLYSNKEKDV